MTRVGLAIAVLLGGCRAAPTPAAEVRSRAPADAPAPEVSPRELDLVLGDVSWCGGLGNRRPPLQGRTADELWAELLAAGLEPWARLPAEPHELGAELRELGERDRWTETYECGDLLVDASVGWSRALPSLLAAELLQALLLQALPSADPADLEVLGATGQLAVQGDGREHGRVRDLLRRLRVLLQAGGGWEKGRVTARAERSSAVKERGP